MDRIKQAGKTLFKTIATAERERTPLKQMVGEFKSWNDLVKWCQKTCGAEAIVGQCDRVIRVGN